MRYLLALALISACSSTGGDDPTDITRQYIDAVESRDVDALLAVFHPEVPEDPEIRAEADLVFDLLAPRAAAVKQQLDGGGEFQTADRPASLEPPGDRVAWIEYDCGEREPCAFEAVRFDGRWYVLDVD